MSNDDINKLNKDFAVMSNQVHNMSKDIKDIKDTLHQYISTEEKRHVDQDNKMSLALKDKADARDLRKVEDTIKWITRLIIGTVVLALLGLIISNK